MSTSTKVKSATIDPPSGRPFATVGTDRATEIAAVLHRICDEDITRLPDGMVTSSMAEDLEALLAHRDHLHAQVVELQTANTRLLLEAREARAAQDPRLTVGRTKIDEAPPKKPPRLAAENIRFGSSWLCGATIRESRGGYLLAGTMRPNEASALGDASVSGTLVTIPLLDDRGETVEVTLFVRGFKMSLSAKVRDVWDVELDLMGTGALDFGATTVEDA